MNTESDAVNQEKSANLNFYTIRVALIVALGGFLMGFDASVISGVVKFIEPEFQLSKIELGWSVASLALTATFAMLVSGPLSDKIGRKRVLQLAAILFALSALLSALAPSFVILVIARMLGGLGVGAALIIAPVYIAEISPAQKRGFMVSFNQLNIVIGISVAFFSNYVILQLANSSADWLVALNLSQYQWRWMLGVEFIPAIIYFLALFTVPESPRWQMMNQQVGAATETLRKTLTTAEAQQLIGEIATNDQYNSEKNSSQLALTESVKQLLSPKLRLVLLVGVAIAILQQITGINSVFFYAPMIFEQTGLGTDAAFMQAVYVGLTNLVFTLVAIAVIDKLGRKPLLVIGVSGIALCMFTLAYGFNSASYQLTAELIAPFPEQIQQPLLTLLGQTFSQEKEFKQALLVALNQEQFQQYQSELTLSAITINNQLILLAILAFVACFAISLGPVMWVLFSELFPNQIRGIAIALVGLINSAVSFLVQLLFPWQLEQLGAAWTFAGYGIFAALGLLIILKWLPETKGKSLEALEKELCR